MLSGFRGKQFFPVLICSSGFTNLTSGPERQTSFDFENYLNTTPVLFH